MIPVTQTKAVIKNSAGDFVVRGNCYAAAIASLLELPITEVPNVEVLFDIDGLAWEEVLDKFLAHKTGCKIIINKWYNVFHDLDYIPESGNRQEALEYCTDKYYLASGMSPRGVYHVCIFQNGGMVHDPHPTREGITDIRYFEEIIKL